MRTLVANMGILAVGEVFTKAFTLVAFVLLARHFGPAVYGGLEFALAVVFVLTLIIDFGLGLYGAREIATHPENVPGIVREVVTARFWLVLVSLAILAGFTALVHKSSEEKILMILFGLTLLPAPLLLQWVFQGLDKTQYMSIAQLLRYGVFALAVLAVVKLNLRLWYVAGAEMLGVLAAAAFMLFSYFRRYGRIRVLEPALPNRRLLIEAFPIGLSTLMWAIKYVFMTVLLGLIVTDAAELGRFSAALRVIVAAHTFIALYLYNLLPTVSRCSTEPPEALRRLLAGAVRLCTWASLALCMVGTAAADTMIRVMYKEQYADSAVVFQILIWMLAAALVSSHFRVTLIAYGKQGMELLSTSCGALVTVVLVWLLYHRFGLRGAATAMVMGEATTLIISYWLVEACVMRTRIWRHLLAPAAVGVVLVAANLALASQPAWLKISIILAIVVAGLVLLDRKIVRGVSSIFLAPSLADSRVGP
jgi:O-antigen/teichoic acid export membrane protein